LAEETWPPLSRGGDDAQLSLLLAVRHGASLLRLEDLVPRHDPLSRQDARGESQSRLASQGYRRAPVRELAREQRGLGAVPEPVLGHAAADLALRGLRGRPLRREHRRAQGRAGGARTAGSAPSVRRSGYVP